MLKDCIESIDSIETLAYETSKGLIKEEGDIKCNNIIKQYNTIIKQYENY